LNNNLAIYGAGGFGREVAVMISQINKQTPTWRLIGFFDDGLARNSDVDGHTLLGGINEINAEQNDLCVCVAVADPFIRYDLIQRITNQKIIFPTIVHPQSNVGDAERNKFGKGCIITAGVILTTGIEISEFCILNLSSTIGHDVELGSFCTVMPGCSLSGNVSIGSRCLFGTGSRVIQGITIGENCIIGAGSVVTRNFESNLRIVGVPARGIKSMTSTVVQPG
jgi:sugar O-acyltransferase (sialic acid O-acetyltransferase NeuD family)